MKQSGHELTIVDAAMGVWGLSYWVFPFCPFLDVFLNKKLKIKAQGPIGGGPQVCASIRLTLGNFGATQGCEAA